MPRESSTTSARTPARAAPPAAAQTGPAAAIPADVAAKLQDTLRMLASTHAFRIVWSKCLTRSERSTLGPDMMAAAADGRGALAMWMRFHRVWKPRAVARLGRDVGLLTDADFHWLDRELRPLDPTASKARRRRAAEQEGERDVEGDEAPDSEDLVAEAARRYDLVLVDAAPNRRVYWKEERVKGPWGRRDAQWQLLRLLAEAAPGGRGSGTAAVGWDQVSRTSQGAIVDRRSRLGRMLPHDLNGLIVPGADPGSYVLRLGAASVHLMDLPADQWLDPDDD